MHAVLYRATRALFVAAGALFLAACASDPVTSNFDPTADLSKYNTYAFLADLNTDKGEGYGSLETTYTNSTSIPISRLVHQYFQKTCPTATGTTVAPIKPSILYSISM